MYDRIGRCLIITLAAFVCTTRVAAAADGHDAPAHETPSKPDPAPAAKPTETKPAEGPKTDAHANAPAAADAHDDPEGVPADDAIRMLVDGNDRFVNGASERPHQEPSRLADTYANGQHPFAAVLSCADSRVPVEIVFDAGIGDLFVIRVAGNVADVDEVATIEYGVEHLGINAILVMGHTKCGAVTAVVDGAKVSPNIAQLVGNIVPAVKEAKTQYPTANKTTLVAKATEANVRLAAAELLERSPMLKERVKSGDLKIVGGVYDIRSGQVRWLDAAPSPIGAATSRKSAKAAEPENTADEHKNDEKSDEKPADATHDAPSRATPATHGHDEKDAPEDKKSHGDEQGHRDEKAAHGEEHSEAKPADAKAEKPVKENFLALGGLMVGATVVSSGIIFLTSSRKS